MKYSEFSKIFLKEFVIEPPKCLDINNYAINLIIGKYLSYQIIQSLRFTKLEIFTVYIKTNLDNSFIGFTKSLIRVFFSLSQNLKKFLHICQFPSFKYLNS